ncbi:glycosyltransferase family 2 protein [Paenibacillus sp. YN15]|uniref:glycosyltransferase family 2 protein n=1 Tax=Paenibacillus sp. YN15 TaxID=1742774 RepID=UPI000DCD9A4E|nr:glycosyltransferase family 2 protein [Paenibacillus sp. YN15]RAU94054.1 glycosyltransferase family 2 protein [Paenibacillus sp. YN15]
MKKELAILLATYNGEKYIHELLDSILLTSYIDSLNLYVRDDGSTDRTVEILKQYELKYNDSIRMFCGENVGTAQGFNYLLKKSLDDGHVYFMFADQDDKWINKKIDQVLECFKAGNNDKPRLVHSDLYVASEDLKIIAESFWQYQHLNPQYVGINRLLIQNVVTGCTIGMNRKLAELVYPIPKEAIMHDWWAALTASALGTIEAIHEPLVYYRQHNSNTIGAQKYSLSIKKIKEPFIISKYTRQAEAFYARHFDQLDEKQRETFKAFISLSSVSRLHAVQHILTHSFYKNGAIRNIGFLAKMLFQNRL